MIILKNGEQMKIIFDIPLIFCTSQHIVSQIEAPGYKTFLQKKSLASLYRY